MKIKKTLHNIYLSPNESYVTGVWNHDDDPKYPLIQPILHHVPLKNVFFTTGYTIL